MSEGIPEISRNYLKTNLAALRARSPVLFERICSAMQDEHIILDYADSGHLTAKLNLEPETRLHSASDPVREASEAVAQLSPVKDRSIVCLGLGLGYYLNALLSVANPCRPILAYERDPWLLRLTLTLFDFSRDILAGRVEFLLGVDIIQALANRSTAFMIWPHPVLGGIYEEEGRILDCDPLSFSSGRRAMVVAGGLFVSDVIEALRDNQIHSLTWDARSVSREETVYQIRSFDPHLVVSINYCSGFPELCESMGIPLVIWEIDPTIERLPPHSQKGIPLRTFIYTYRKSRVAHYLSAGFRNVEYLPLGANPKRRRPLTLNGEERQKFGADISFVGSSMFSEADRLLQLSRELSKKTGDAHNDAQELSLPESSVVQDDRGRFVDLSSCVAETAASERRARILSLLSSRNYDLRIWGDAGWRSILPAKAQYCGMARHNHEVTRIYNGAKINLDINRIYQQDIVTMRVFDILACKGFVLADYGECLEEMFDLGREVIAYRSETELPVLIDHFMANDREREELAMAGHQRVLKDHTILSRVRNMLQNLP